jgi:hypothetical protein
MGRGFFPGRPARLLGRAREVRALVARLAGAEVARLALVGGGGSGKSLLACEVGHRLRGRFPGGIHWLRVGGWDSSTLFEMLSRRLGVAAAGAAGATGAERSRRLVRARRGRPRALVVLDNHENDRAVARFLDALRACPVTWLLTARRCLLSGVEIFPVVPPLSTARGRVFPRVAALTELLRWNPLALDIADALVSTGAVSLPGLRRWLVVRGVARVAPMADEDDVAEVRLLVDWAWPRLPAGARRMLAVLAHCEGDDVDTASLAQLAGARAPATAAAALRALRRFRLVQESLPGRLAIHAVVRRAVARRTHVPGARYFRHYLGLLERHPERAPLEQTHLFAAMDHAHRTSDLAGALRIERLLEHLDQGLTSTGRTSASARPSAPRRAGRG